MPFKSSHLAHLPLHSISARVIEWSICVSALIISAIYVSAFASPRAPSLELQGHRGARGLAPENTRPAFNLAYLHGMTTLELDTTLTADGQLIVHHDTMTNATLCTGPDEVPITSRPVLELTIDQLQALECGLRPHPRFPEQRKMSARPPRLTEVIALEELWGVTPLYNVEIKTDERHTSAHRARAVEALGQAIEELSRERPTLAKRVTVQSFDFEVLEIAARRLPTLRRSALFEPRVDHSVTPPRITNDVDHMISEVQRVRASVISPYHVVVTEALIQRAHAHGFKVIPWTVNDAPRMRTLIALGVDGLISDYPDRLNRVVRQMGPAVACRARSVDRACQTPYVDSPRSINPSESTRSPLVELSSLDPSITLDIRYAGQDNFVGRPVRGYEARKCLLTRPAAEALIRAQMQLKASGLSLKVFDCFRPQRAVDDFVLWARDLKDRAMKRRYYPDVPKSELFSRGYIAARSGHSRGSTIDLTIEGLDMGTPWDFFGVKSHTKRADLPIKIRAHRMLLTSVMSAHGWINYEKEWWHYTFSPEPFPHLYFDLPIK